MMGLMTEFFGGKPGLTAKIESFTSAHYGLTTAFSEDLNVPIEDAVKVFEELEEKINNAKYVKIEAPKPVGKAEVLSGDKLNMLRVLVDYFSESPKMVPGSHYLAKGKDVLIDTYNWFFGGTAEEASDLLEQLSSQISSQLPT